MSKERRRDAGELRAIMNALAESAGEATYDQLAQEMADEGATATATAERVRRLLLAGLVRPEERERSARGSAGTVARERSREMDAIRRLPYAGAIDADGHILEAPDLWEHYLEPGYRERAMRLRRDAHGLEYLEIDGRPSKVVRGGMLGMLGGMGKQLTDVLPSPEHTYVGGASFGALDAGERLQRLSREGLDAAFLYPTLGVLWEAECTDPEIAQAYTRAYNRWIIDFCADSGGRLIPIAHLSLGDPTGAARELERAVRAGARGGWVAPFTMTKRPHGHPDHDPLFAAAQDLDVPLAIHPTFEPKWAAPGRFEELHGANFFLNVTAADAVRHAFTSLFQFATFDRFPRLRVILLESGAGWIGYWLDRMDGYAASLLGRAVPLKDRPSTYFRRQCFISCDPDERTIPALMELYGEDRFFWASDFPHPDHTGDYLEELGELAAALPEPARRNLLGDNVRRAYGITA